jgi:hypothetical protein
MRPWKDLKLAALGESATCVRLVPSNSKKWLGVLKTPQMGGGGGGGLLQARFVTGLAITSTLPFGNKEAGPSATA